MDENKEVEKQRRVWINFANEIKSRQADVTNSRRDCAAAEANLAQVMQDFGYAVHKMFPYPTPAEKDPLHKNE